jgi:hypothetical protein
VNEKDYMDFKDILITNEIARAKCASNSACTTVRPRTFRVFMEDEVDSLSIYIDSMYTLHFKKITKRYFLIIL